MARTAVLSVRVSAQQRAALERLAQQRSQAERRNVDVSEIVRELIDKERASANVQEAGELPIL
jgi:uncharacterized protein with von Willebrand factor type A (vWA) domain